MSQPKEPRKTGRDTTDKTAKLPAYSVLMSVYCKDVASWVEEALRSMIFQSHRPAEMIVIEDGPVPSEIHEVIMKYKEMDPCLIRCISFSQNKGLAEAMRLGVEECKYDWIARMDADDVSAEKRCEEELTLALACNADIAGCDCEEFIGHVSHPVSRRVFPADHESLIRFSKRKVPFCHPAVMMKKQAVLRAGNYHNVFPHDDYDLFVRMLATGAIGCTVKKTLFHVRVNENFYKRRGGIRYVKTLLGFNCQLLKNGWMSPVDFFVRSCGNVLLGLSPVCIRTLLYRRLLRK